MGGRRIGIQLPFRTLFIRGRTARTSNSTSFPSTRRAQLRPTLLYIYGGGWVNGIKGSVTLAPLPYLFRGMNAVVIDYRVADNGLAPAAVEDCRCAFRWIYTHAKEYGFDTSKIVVAGESAGGHLALITAMLDASAGFDNECPAKDGDAPPLKRPP